MTLTNVTLHVEIAFSAGPYDLSPTWTDVTPYVRHVATKRGRNNEFDQIEAGTCTLTLDNADGRFTPARTISPDPYKNNILPRKQMRVRAVVNSTSKPIFKGYTERWSLTHPGGGGYSEAVCECTDAFKILSTTKVLDFYGESVQQLNPAAYYPLSEPAGTVLFGDHSGQGRPAGVLWKRTANDQSSAGADVLVGTDSSVSFDPDGAAGGSDIDLTAAMPVFPFKTDDWSSSFWFKLGSNYYPGGRSNPPIPGPDPSPPSPVTPPSPYGPGGSGSAPTVTPGGGPGDPNTNPGIGTIGWDTSGSGTGASGVDGWRVTPDNGLPFDVTPANIAASGFPTIPLTDGACNSVTIQAHSSSGFSAPSPPSACTTNEGSKDIYDKFDRGDTAHGSGPGTATNGETWGDPVVDGLQVYQQECRADNEGQGAALLDTKTKDQDFVAWVKGTHNQHGFFSEILIPFRAENWSTNWMVHLHSDGSTPIYNYNTNLQINDVVYAVSSSNYPLDAYCGYHVQAIDYGSHSEFLLARDGEILFSSSSGPTAASGQTKIGLSLQNTMRCNLIEQGNSDKPRCVRAVPLAGGARFFARPPRSGVPEKYRVKVGGLTVESAASAIDVTGLADFADYTWTMSAKPRGKQWGPDTDIGHVKPGWAAAPVIGTATMTGTDQISLTYTLGDANSVDYTTNPIKVVSDKFNFQEWSFSYPYPNPLILTGVNPGFDEFTRFRVYVSGVWNEQRGCETVSEWSNAEYV